MRKTLAGFTIIELIVFIVVIGIIGTVILIPLGTMLRDAEVSDQSTVAMALAQARMEWRYAQRQNLGYDIFADGNSNCTQEICTFVAIPSGYSIITNVTTGYSGSTNYKQLTVKVTGEKKGQGNAELSLLLGNY